MTGAMPVPPRSGVGRAVPDMVLMTWPNAACRGVIYHALGRNELRPYNRKSLSRHAENICSSRPPIGP